MTKHLFAASLMIMACSGTGPVQKDIVAKQPKEDPCPSLYDACLKQHDFTQCQPCIDACDVSTYENSRCKAQLECSSNAESCACVQESCKGDGAVLCDQCPHFCGHDCVIPQ